MKPHSLMAEVRKVQEQSFRRSRGIHSFPGNKKPATSVFTFWTMPV